MATTTTNAQGWRAQVRPMTDAPPELVVDGLDDRLRFGSPEEIDAALAERRANLNAYRQRTGAAAPTEPPAQA
jgi:hypothetical protein